MRAITLIQPWASLITLGFKKIETRSWDTKYRGPLAIHAAQTMPCRLGERLTVGMFEVERDRSGLLMRGPINWPYRLPLGAVIGKASVTHTLSTNDPDCGPSSRLERPFGDYSPDRFAWYLSDVHHIRPVPMKGRLGLWNAPFVAEPTECICCDRPIVFGELATWTCDGEAYHPACAAERQAVAHV